MSDVRLEHQDVFFIAFKTPEAGLQLVLTLKLSAFELLLLPKGFSLHPWN